MYSYCRRKGNSRLNNLKMDFSYKIIIPVYGKVALWDTKIFWSVTNLKIQPGFAMYFMSEDVQN